MRLTPDQLYVLHMASRDKPIYAENPSRLDAQTPDGSFVLPLRTAQSLVRRGLLREDGRGGYLLTDEGGKVA